MKNSSQMRKILINAGIFFLAITLFVCCMLGVNNAYAAETRTTIFTEDMEEAILEDDVNWKTSKENSESIEIGYVGKSMFLLGADTISGVSAIQFDDAITLDSNQYAEFIYTFEGVKGSPFLDFKFSETKANSASDLKIGEGEGVSFLADPTWLRGKIYSSNNDLKMGNGWCQLVSANSDYAGLQWYSGDMANGPTTIDAGKYSVKVKIFPTGKAIYSVAGAYENNWFDIGVVGMQLSNVTWSWSDAGSFAPLSSGYMQLIIRNIESNYFGTLKKAVYSYTDFNNIILGTEAGVLVEGSAYEDSFASVDSSKFKAISGSMELKAAEKAIIIDNAADNDYLIKTSKLSAPQNKYAENVYDINFDMMIPELVGTAKAVVYMGSESDTDITSATKLEFSLNGENKVVISCGTDEFITDVELAKLFKLRVLSGGDDVNEVYINSQLALSFTKDLSQKFICIGTTGVDTTNKACFALVKGGIYKYNYQQGTGGDFTENFENGKYNMGDIVCYYQVLEDEMPLFFYADEESGDLVVDNVGYSGVVSTKQSYGDFEFTLELSSLKMVKGEDDADIVPNFAIAWGRPNGESDYAVPNCAFVRFISESGSILYNDGIGKYAEGYNGSFSTELKLPDGKVDGEGASTFTNDIYKYDFSEGNLVFKLVHQGSNTKLFIYTENSAVDSWGRLNPVIVLEEDFSYGTIGICGVPTGRNMSMTIDTFEVKNIDEHKADTLIVGTAEEYVDLDFTPKQQEEIVDPFDPKTDDKTPDDKKPEDNKSQDDKESSGCGSSVNGLYGLVVIPVLVALVISKKRKEN